jgi:hypothetical protein
MLEGFGYGAVQICRQQPCIACDLRDVAIDDEEVTTLFNCHGRTLMGVAKPKPMSASFHLGLRLVP